MRDGVVLGVDPSLRGTGLAVIKFWGGKPTLLFSQVIKTKGDMPAALGQITQSVKNVCEQFRPELAAIESTIFAQNHRTAITLGASRGAAVAVLSLYSIPCTDLAPTRIKQAVVGTGRASKTQVAKMVQALLKLPEPLPSFDESDAAAAALAVVF
jgi:crossover junction endodeoxyribonuclease RuvC